MSTLIGFLSKITRFLGISRNISDIIDNPDGARAFKEINKGKLIGKIPYQESVDVLEVVGAWTKIIKPERYNNQTPNNYVWILTEDVLFGDVTHPSESAYMILHEEDGTERRFDEVE